MRTRTSLTLAASIVLSLSASCTTPDLDIGGKAGDSCQQLSDCALGFVCDTENAECVAGYDGKHGVSKDKIVLGSSVALTGPIEALGQAYTLGFQAYFHHVNTQLGGVHGRQIEFLATDDGYDVPTAVTNARMLTDGSNRKVFAMVGNMGSPTTEATLPVTNGNGTVLFAPYTGADITRKDPPERLVFNLRASYQDEAETLARYMLNVREPSVPVDNITVLAQADPNSTAESWQRLDAYGLDGFLGLASVLKAAKDVPRESIFFTSYKRGGSVVDEAIEQNLRWMASPERIERDGKIVVGIVMQVTSGAGIEFISKIKDELRLIRAQGISTLVDPALTTEEIDRLKKVDLVLATTSPVGNALPNTLLQRQSADKPYCDGVIVSQVVPLPTSNAKGVVNYREQLKAFNANAVPGFASLEGYLAARLFVEALDAAGPDLTDDLLIDTLESLQSVDLGIGVEVGFSPTQHQASTKIWGSALDSQCVYQSFTLE